MFLPVCSLVVNDCCLCSWGSMAACACCGGSCGPIAACGCCGGSWGPIKERKASRCCDGGSWGPIGAAASWELVATAWELKSWFGSVEKAVKGWDASLAGGTGSGLFLEVRSKNKKKTYKQ